MNVHQCKGWGELVPRFCQSLEGRQCPDSANPWRGGQCPDTANPCRGGGAQILHILGGEAVPRYCQSLEGRGCPDSANHWRRGDYDTDLAQILPILGGEEGCVQMVPVTIEKPPSPSKVSECSLSTNPIAKDRIKLEIWIKLCDLACHTKSLECKCSALTFEIAV